MARTPFDVLSESHIALLKQLAEAIALNDRLTEENQKLARRLLDINNGTLNNRIANGASSLLHFSGNSTEQTNQSNEHNQGPTSEGEATLPDLREGIPGADNAIN